MISVTHYGGIKTAKVDVLRAVVVGVCSISKNNQFVPMESGGRRYDTTDWVSGVVSGSRGVQCALNISCYMRLAASGCGTSVVLLKGVYCRCLWVAAGGCVFN